MTTEQQSQEPDFTRNNGLLPAIAQDADSGKILMMAWMNAEAYRETVQTGRAVYFSRSRQRLCCVKVKRAGTFKSWSKFYSIVIVTPF